MADDNMKVREQDFKRINTNDDYEIRDWVESLGVTEAQLRKAVAAVGDQAEKVGKFLGKK